MADALLQEIADLQTLMEKHLKLAGEFTAQAARARRHLPQSMRRRLERLVEALERMDHPKLALTLDEAGLVRDAKAIQHHLKTVNLADRRKGRLLDIAATVAFAVIILIALLVLVLRWRGFV